jgi:hypothetical protein
MNTDLIFHDNELLFLRHYDIMGIFTETVYTF